jgi:hypothetical protein
MGARLIIWRAKGAKGALCPEVAGSNPAPGTRKHYFGMHIIEVVCVVDISSWSPKPFLT